MSELDEFSPTPQKKLSLKEVARRFETGDDQVLEDYRTINLKETSAQLLHNMPKGKALMKELLQLAEELAGRVAGKNSDDASRIRQGLLDLQAQWKTYEQSAKQAAKELTDSAAASASASQQQDPSKDAHYQDRIKELEGECASLRKQVAEREEAIQQLQEQLGETNVPCLASPDQKENHSPMRDSSNLGANDQSAVSLASLLRRPPVRSSPVKRFPSLSTLSEEAVSPALLRTLSIIGSPEVGQTLSVVVGERAAPDDLLLQWLREDPAEGQTSVISGAVRHQYSPEVADVGCTILCRVGASGNAEADADSHILRSASAVAADAGLDIEAAQLEAAGGATFFVVPVQHNGVVQRKRTVASLKVDANGLSVASAGAELAASGYHADMQVCGARGGGDGAAQGMFLALDGRNVFMLALETPWKRNLCISLVRKMAARHGLSLDGPREASV